MGSGTLATALAFIWGASATAYFECQDPNTYKVSPGIQVPCDKIRDDWCATDCNFLGRNCDYCQYIPTGIPSLYDGGPLGDAVSELVSWCGGENYVTSNGKRHYPKIVAYLYSQKRSCRGCGGCSYYNNGNSGKTLFERQSDLSPSDNVTIATGDAPGASVVLEQLVVGADVDAMNCTLLYQEAASVIAANYSESRIVFPQTIPPLVQANREPRNTVSGVPCVPLNRVVLTWRTTYNRQLTDARSALLPLMISSYLARRWMIPIRFFGSPKRLQRYL